MYLLPAKYIVEFYLQSLKYIVFRIVPILMLCACFAALKLEDVRTCMGDPEANADNPLLKAEQDAQVGYSSALRSLFCFVIIASTPCFYYYYVLFIH